MLDREFAKKCHLFLLQPNYKVLFIPAIERHWRSLPLAPNSTAWASSPPQHITHTHPRAQSQVDYGLPPRPRRTSPLSSCSVFLGNCDLPDSSLSVILRYLKFLMSVNHDLPTATKRSSSKPFHLAVYSAPIQPSASRG